MSQQQFQQQTLPPQAVPITYPQPQQQPVMMASGAVQYVSGQQPTVQLIPAAPQGMVVAPQTVSWIYV